MEITSIKIKNCPPVLSSSNVFVDSINVPTNAFLLFDFFMSNWAKASKKLPINSEPTYYETYYWNNPVLPDKSLAQSYACKVNIERDNFFNHLVYLDNLFALVVIVYKVKIRLLRGNNLCYLICVLCLCNLYMLWSKHINFSLWKAIRWQARTTRKDIFEKRLFLFIFFSFILIYSSFYLLQRQLYDENQFMFITSLATVILIPFPCFLL